MKSILFIFLIPAGCLFGQSAAPGRTTITGLLDPRVTPPPLPVPAVTLRRRSRGVTASETAARQIGVSQRRPTYIGPTLLEMKDLATVGLAPSELPRRPLALSPTAAFEGIPETHLAPPSPDIAVGPAEVLMTVHSSIARYSKTGQQLNLMTLQQWFSSILPTVCPAGADRCNMFDPSIRFDSLHGRFLVLAFSEDTTTERSYFVISVSNGATYDSGWKHWALRGNLNGAAESPYEVDFPQMGYDNNAVYLTANMFDALGQLRYAKLRILKKSELYSPDTTVLTYQDFWDMRNQDQSVVVTLRPTELRGAPGEGVTPGVLINASEIPNASYLTLWRVQNPTSTTPTLERTVLNGVWPYDFPAAFPSLDTTQFLSAGSPWVLRAIRRNGILYSARNSGYIGVPTTVTYDRIDLARNQVTSQARLTGGRFFYPAFDVPASHGPGNTIPDGQITGSSTDSSGALSYIGIPGVKSGEDSYNVVNGRWGDFFGASLDPVQGGLWVSGEYAKKRTTARGVWGTYISYFPWTTSPQFTDVSSSSAFFDAVNVMRLWSITTGCTATTYCPNANVPREQMAVFLIRAIVGENFTSASQPYFTDVPASHPFFRYIQKLKELGISDGCSATTFCPAAMVTRGQMAAFVIRGKMRALHGENFPSPATPYFSDVPAANSFFTHIQKLRELGVTGGCSATAFCPDSLVTREQMAAFITRAFLN